MPARSAPNTPATLAARQRHPTALALDAEYVYWTDALAGTVMRVPKRGGDAVALARGLECPLSLALDGEAVYVAISAEDGAIARIPLAGGTPTRIARGQCFPMDVAVDDARVYWTCGGDDRDNGQVWSVAKAGGAPVLIAAGESGPQGIGVDAGGVYWLTRNDHIRRAEKADGSVATLYRPAEPIDDRIATGEQDDAASATEDTPLLRSRDPWPIRRIAVVEERVYWRDVSGSPVEVVHSGNAPVESTALPLIVDPDAPCNVAVHGHWLYWTDPREGRVVRVRCVGGRARVCASSESRPLAIAVDASAIYWSVVGTEAAPETGAIRVLRN